LNDVTKDSFPMKFFEYLAAGKPVVATELPSLSEFAHLFATAQNAQSFSAAIRDALKRNNDESRSWQLSNSVSEYGWNRRIEDLSSAVIQAICSG
jgi:glycosyltransferase involved in cell wall biosynthesis